jgi:hypothetical protein
MARYTTTFNKAKFFSADVANLAVGAIKKIGEYKVQAGEILTIGEGKYDTFPDALGRIYGKLMDTNATTPAEITGLLRFSIHSPQGRPLKTMFEMHTSKLNTSAGDRRLQTPLSERIEELTEDKKLVIELIPETIGNGTLDYETSVLLLDVTIDEV